MIISGHLLMVRSPGRCHLVPGVIRVRDDRIESVELGQATDRCDLGGPDYVVSSGWIDTHLHLPQFDQIGAHGMPLMDWLSEVTFPSEMKWSDPVYASSMTRRVGRQLLKHGTTAVAAYASVHHQAAIEATRVLEEMGFRGIVGQVLMDREAPPELCANADQLLDQANILQDRFPSDRRMSVAVTPRFAITCTPRLLAGAGQLAKEHKAKIQTHLAETERECRRVEELFGGQRYVGVYEEAGLLTDQTIFGHGIYLDDDDQRRLQNSGSVIAHCPTANRFLRSGAMNRSGLLANGVSVSLGSDIGAGYERSMVRVARAMIETASSISESHPSASEAWYMITAGNAAAMGWPDAGRIATEAIADLVIFRPDIDWQQQRIDPLSMLMFAWDDRWITEVVLRGQPVFF